MNKEQAEATVSFVWAMVFVAFFLGLAWLVVVLIGGFLSMSVGSLVAFVLVGLLGWAIGRMQG